MKRWSTLCLSILLFAALTACGRTRDAEPASPAAVEQETGAVSAASAVSAADTASAASADTSDAEAADTITVSTTGELVRSIAPDAHILLKSGTYDLSALTEEEMAERSGCVELDALREGSLALYNAHGLVLEAEEEGTVRLVTGNGYVDVVTLTLCDGAKLKGLVLGHEVEKGECDADVLRLSTSQNVTVEDCGLFGCGTYGIGAEDSALLTVTGTEIYECTYGIFSLIETTDTVFENCRFYDNQGMFFLWENSEVVVKNTSITGNRGALLQGIRKGEDPGNIGITFQNCSFRDDPEMGAAGDWSCAVFEDCDFSTSPADSFSEK